MHILVMTESWGGALACIQSFGGMGHTVSVIAGKRKSPHCQSRFVNKIVELPAGSDMAATARNLIALSDRLKVDLVVPISDRDAEIVALAKEQAPNVDAFVTSPLKSIQTARDRNSTIRLCERLGIPTPPTLCIDDNTNVTEAAETVGFPLFVKSSGTTASKGVRFVTSPDQLHTVLDQLPDKNEFQLQRQIVGDYRGVTGFADGGKLIASYAFGTEYRHSLAGTPPYGTLVEDHQLDEMLSKIASALDWSGGIDLDCIQTEGGQAVLLEINPRFSGTVMFPLKLGLDLPSFYLSARTGENSKAVGAVNRSKGNAFINLPAEVRYISMDPRTRMPEAQIFRRTHSCVDSMFWDDPPLARAMLPYLLSVAWAPQLM